MFLVDFIYFCQCSSVVVICMCFVFVFLQVCMTSSCVMLQVFVDHFLKLGTALCVVFMADAVLSSVTVL